MPITINGSGTITGLSVGGLPDGIVDTDMIANNAVNDAKSSLTTGKILQVIQTNVTDTVGENVNTGAFFHFDELDTTITPSAATSKILVTGSFSVGISSSMNVYGKLVRDVGGSNLDINLGDQAGSRRVASAVTACSANNHEDTMGIMFLDSPNTTSAVKYEIWMSHPSSSTRTIYLNRNHVNDDSSVTANTVSTLTLMEVAA